jgi:hypothetical protein
MFFYLTFAQSPIAAVVSDTFIESSRITLHTYDVHILEFVRVRVEVEVINGLPPPPQPRDPSLILNRAVSTN